MSSIIQFLKLLISGKSLKGIKFRTRLSIIIAIFVLITEIAVYTIYWDSIPNMIEYDYDFSGTPNDICEKECIWYNVLLQIFICAFVFIAKYLSYHIKCVHSIVYDENNNLIPILNKRFSMFAWETAMLFVTTEQGYIFALIDIIGSPICDDIVTLIFLFWQIVLIVEFLSDIKALKNNNKNLNDMKKEHNLA